MSCWLFSNLIGRMPRGSTYGRLEPRWDVKTLKQAALVLKVCEKSICVRSGNDAKSIGIVLINEWHI